eukprot:1812304-Pyramimonas_sp.AAC.1
MALQNLQLIHALHPPVEVAYRDDASPYLLRNPLVRFNTFSSEFYKTLTPRASRLIHRKCLKTWEPLYRLSKLVGLGAGRQRAASTGERYCKGSRHAWIQHRRAAIPGCAQDGGGKRAISQGQRPQGNPQHTRTANANGGVRCRLYPTFVASLYQGP